MSSHKGQVDFICFNQSLTNYMHTLQLLQLHNNIMTLFWILRVKVEMRQ